MTGRGKGENIVFENFDWDVEVPTRHLAFDAKVGQLETAPGIIYTVRKVIDRKDGQNYYLYVVDAEAYGCALRNLRLETPDAVKEYLSRQFDLVARFGEAGEKRDKLAARIRPLSKKLEQNSKTIFNLLHS